MKTLLIITTLTLSTLFGYCQKEQPNKKVICTGKAHEVQTHFGGDDTHDYWLYFKDGAIVKTSRKYYACYQRGDTAVFIYRALYDRDGKYRKSIWQMYNKCPYELK